MNKGYIFFIISFIVTIAYFDMLDNCEKINKIIAEMIQLDSQIRTEIDINSK